MSVRIGRVGGGPLFGNEGANKGSFGFRVGVKGPLDEYRNNLIFGKGLEVGISANGYSFGLGGDGAFGLEDKSETTEIEIRIAAEPAAGGLWKISSAFGPPDGAWSAHGSSEVLEEFLRDRLRGNVALVANFPAPQSGRRRGFGTGKFWFADWKLEGDKVDAHDDRAFGPILFSQYTLHDDIVKLTAQMPPLGEKDSQTVLLQLKEADGWHTIGKETVHPQARTATFRLEKWDATKEVPYRLVYDEKAHGAQPAGVWEGTIRRDPVEQPVLTVADVSCNTHAAFPNHAYVANVAKLDPDLLAFVGDQFYESSGGYGVVRKPLETAILDYLRKWYMHGWTWRELTRDRPSISLPDDHDVYQGNIWGEAGGREEDDAGGGRLRHARRLGERRASHANVASPRPVRPYARQAEHQRLLRAADLWPRQLRDHRRPPVQDGPGRQRPADRRPRRSRHRPELRSEDGRRSGAGTARRTAAEVPARLGDGLARCRHEGRDLADDLHRAWRRRTAPNASGSRADYDSQRLAADGRATPRSREIRKASRSTRRRSAPARRRALRHRRASRRRGRVRRAGDQRRLSPLVGAGTSGREPEAGRSELPAISRTTSAIR